MKLETAALAALCLAAGSAGATNGYFPHGYGIRAQGMGGATTAIAEDALGGAVARVERGSDRRGLVAPGRLAREVQYAVDGAGELVVVVM